MEKHLVEIFLFEIDRDIADMAGKGAERSLDLPYLPLLGGRMVDFEDRYFLFKLIQSIWSGVEPGPQVDELLDAVVDTGVHVLIDVPGAGGYAVEKPGVPAVDIPEKSFSNKRKITERP